jgi:colanic acid biosynthesis protein WcaH
MTQRLNDQDFLAVIDATPLISIDLVVRDHEGRILLGYRDNKPAQYYWFVPGGRVRKNERLAQAFARLTQVELNLPFRVEQANFLGPYEHLYEDNFLGKNAVGTHYVVLAYELRLAADQHCALDDQHSEQRWWAEEELLASEVVHPNTKAYFDRSYC